MDRDLDLMEIFSILLNLENLRENQEQSARQEKILQEISEKFDRMEKMIMEAKKDGAL